MDRAFQTCYKAWSIRWRRSGNPARRIASREILPTGKILVRFLLAHLFVSSQIAVDLAPVVEATPRLALLAGWVRCLHESRVGGWQFSHQQEASSLHRLCPQVCHWTAQPGTRGQMALCLSVGMITFFVEPGRTGSPGREQR